MVDTVNLKQNVYLHRRTMTLWGNKEATTYINRNVEEMNQSMTVRGIL